MKKLVWIVLLLCACSTSPTGRRQLTVMPEGQMAVLGSDSFSEMKKKMQIERDPRVNAYVRCVADPIIREVADQVSIQDWEIVVFKEKSANAFALPGGKIGVHTGMLNVAKTSEQLAAVLGHEVGHVQAKHGNERVSQALATQGGLAVVAGAIGKGDATSRSLMAALGLGAQVGLLLPFGRTQESEADQLGLEHMAHAGFDPRESVELWKNMRAMGGTQPPEFMSTHPSHDTRIRELESGMPEALKHFEGARSRGKNPQCHL